MTGMFVGRWDCRECDRIWIEFAPPGTKCPECDLWLAYSVVNDDDITLKLPADSGPQPGREDVNLAELSEDRADAIRAIVAGRSVIYRCEVRDASICTTAGYVLAGNRFKDVRVNDAPQIVSGNDMENTQVGQPIGSRVTRNVMK